MNPDDPRALPLSGAPTLDARPPRARDLEYAATLTTGGAALATSPSFEPLDFARRYTTAGTLGAGGMGEVRLCEDHVIGREVALKIIHEPRMRSHDSVQRFLREARVQGQLEHPAIVPVHELGMTP